MFFIFPTHFFMNFFSRAFLTCETKLCYMYSRLLNPLKLFTQLLYSLLLMFLIDISKPQQNVQTSFFVHTGLGNWMVHVLKFVDSWNLFNYQVVYFCYFVVLAEGLSNFFRTENIGGCVVHYFYICGVCRSFYSFFPFSLLLVFCTYMKRVAGVSIFSSFIHNILAFIIALNIIVKLFCLFPSRI